jgi:arylsulfatase A-like enzyme
MHARLVYGRGAVVHPSVWRKRTRGPLACGWLVALATGLATSLVGCSGGGAAPAAPPAPLVRETPRAEADVLDVTHALAAAARPEGGDDAAGREGSASAKDTGDASPRPGGGGLAAPPSVGDAPPANGRMAVRYDLARHVARAEIREGCTLVIDLGVPGGAKYTLGGWWTGADDDRDVGGVTVTPAASNTLKLALPAESTGAHVVAVRARASARDRLRVFLNGREIGGGELPGDGSFGIVRVNVAAGALRRGENQLLLRGSRPAFAVDWVRLAPDGEALAETAPTPPERLAFVESGKAILEVAPAQALGFALEVPRGARLTGTVLGTGGASLDVVAVRDRADATPQLVARATGTEAGAALDVDLGAMAGEVVRLDLRGVGGSVRVVEPRIVTREVGAPVPGRPVKNVVLYLIDTLRADKLQPFNPRSRVRTPGLARFVEQAAVMIGAHTQENWTKPSVATLLSSLYPWQHNAVTTEAVVPAAVRMLPELLGERGFYTGAFIANGYVSDRFGFRQGWSTYRNYVREGRRNAAQYVAADVLEWLDARPTDKPFFLYVHTIDPHVPYKPPRSFLEMYDPDPYSGVVDFSGDNELLEKIKAGRIPLGPRDRQRLEALYDGEISYHDVHFNAILEGLRRRGLEDDTMFIIVADHGEEFWDHGSVGHGHSVYEELLRVPMVVKLPGTTFGAVRIDDAVGLVDVMPTVLEALGQPLPPDLAGTSFLPLLRGEPADAPRATVSGFMEGWRTVVVGRYKLIHRTIERMMVHDLAADPGEQTDIAAEHPITLRYLRGMLGLTLALAEAPHAGTGALASASGTATAGAGVTDPPPRARPRVHPQETTTIDAETEAQLRALGYVGTSRR